jgi:hypothetical protein
LTPLKFFITDENDILASVTSVTSVTPTTAI